jgi:hypothetical protein
MKKTIIPQGLIMVEAEKIQIRASELKIWRIAACFTQKAKPL